MNSNYKLIIGLGNPGKEYLKTYHNIGILAVEYLAHDAEFKKDSSGIFAYTKQNWVILAKSLSFMNESGRAVAEALRIFGIKPEGLLVVHDDSDLPIGTIKFSYMRGSGGHHGIESILQHLKTKGFSRLRIGIRNPKERSRKKASEFILKKLSSANQKKIEAVFEEVRTILTEPK